MLHDRTATMQYEFLAALTTGQDRIIQINFGQQKKIERLANAADLAMKLG